MRRGIVLAGGAGTRLVPATLGTSKQLLPVYDKPMIYYPLTTLMQAGIREILIITTPEMQPRFNQLLGDGARWGLSLRYEAQPAPDGLAQAFVLGREFLDGRPSALVLGDSIFHGHGLEQNLAAAATRTTGATLFAYEVSDPQRYGVVETTPDGRILSLEEKPASPRSRLAVTGLYFCDGDAPAIAAGLTRSRRGEYEIVDVLAEYHRRGWLHVEFLDRGMAWFDTGTHDSLHDAASYVRSIETRTGVKIGCPEEVAWRRGYIDNGRLLSLAEEMGPCAYADYLRGLSRSTR